MGPECGKLRWIGLVIHLLQNAFLLFGQYASFVKVFDLEMSPQFETSMEIRGGRHTQLLAQFFSYATFSEVQVLPSSPGLRMPALSRHLKYASRLSQQCFRPSLETAVGSGVLLPNQPIRNN
jgi:hypothetical protein